MNPLELQTYQHYGLPLKHQELFKNLELAEKITDKTKRLKEVKKARSRIRCFEKRITNLNVTPYYKKILEISNILKSRGCKFVRLTSTQCMVEYSCTCGTSMTKSIQTIRNSKHPIICLKCNTYLIKILGETEEETMMKARDVIARYKKQNEIPESQITEKLDPAEMMAEIEKLDGEKLQIHEDFLFLKLTKEINRLKREEKYVLKDEVDKT